MFDGRNLQTAELLFSGPVWRSKLEYYTVEEMSGALQRATRTITLLTESCTEYTRGVNDCFALLAEYDYELRDESRARNYVTFHWKSTREFGVKLAREGYSIADYLEYCGCEIINNARPKMGDVAFDDGAMIHDGYSWVSTNETNEGVRALRPANFLERKLLVLARPLRS